MRIKLFCKIMKTLRNVTALQRYPLHQRDGALKLASIQLLFEWRAWAVTVPFSLIGFLLLDLVSVVDSLGGAMLTTVLMLAMIVGGLWLFLLSRVRDWVLVHRHEKILHAIGWQGGTE